MADSLFFEEMYHIFSVDTIENVSIFCFILSFSFFYIFFLFSQENSFFAEFFLQKNLFFCHKINAQQYTRFIPVLENRVAHYVMAMIHDIRKCLHIHVSNILSLMAISGASNTTKSNFKMWKHSTYVPVQYL